MKENKSAKQDFHNIVSRAFRLVDRRNQPLDRDLIPLELTQRTSVFFDPYSAPQGEVLILYYEHGKVQRKKMDFEVVSSYCASLDMSISRENPETQARFFLFSEYGGTADEFKQLQTYAAIRKGDGKKYLPEGIAIKLIYSKGSNDNKDRDGLVEVHFVGGNIPDNERTHTRRFHMVHAPYAIDGRSLERIALSRSAGVDPGIIEKAERAWVNYTVQ